MRLLAVGFWTDDFYRMCAEELLVPSLKRFGIPHRISQKEDLGRHNANVLAHKPDVILQALTDGYDAVLYLDVDARVARRPELFERIEHEIAIAIWDDWLHAGTMYVRNTAEAISMVERWKSECAAAKETVDEKILHGLLQTVYLGKWYVLPPEYCWIEFALRKKFPRATPVIEHYSLGYLKLKRKEVPF